VIDSIKQEQLVARFTEKAKAVSAFVAEVASLNAAIAYTLELCGSRGACRINISGCDEQLSASAGELCATKQEKIVAAPGLDPELFQRLEAACQEAGFSCLREGMRRHLGGIDIGFTIADLGIAETGTLVLNCPGEELRLATMISEYHVCVLGKKAIVADGFAAEGAMRKYLHRTPDYTAFITGASRTADIERVLAMGVHGPLELHILLLED
jgi:L-lactate dehydrogenase complex protein LldG